MQSQVLQENSRKPEYSYKDYLAWPEEEHWEIIEGEAYPTYGPTAFAAPNSAHQTLVVELVKQIAVYLDGKSCRVFVSPYDVIFEESEKTKTVVQPDVLVVCDPSKIRKNNLVGAPDIAVEVLSHSTASKDWMKKSRLYEKQGVKEYWIVSPESKIIYKNTLKDGEYETETLEEGQLTSGVLEDFSLDIKEFFSILNVE